MFTSIKPAFEVCQDALVILLRPFANLGNLLSSNSIVRWHFQSFRRKHARIVAWEENPSGPDVLRFRSPRETEAWLARAGR